MIIGAPSGRYYQEAWVEKDNFNTRRLYEIPLEVVKENCTNSSDYVVYRDLTPRERVEVLFGRIIS